MTRAHGTALQILDVWVSQLIQASAFLLFILTDQGQGNGKHAH